MKTLILILCVSFAFATPSSAQKSEKQSEYASWVKKIKWKSPKRTQIKALDNLYDAGDELHASIMQMADSLVFYDVKMIANETTGDTIVAVVDDQGNIRSGYMAFKQYMSLANAGLTLVKDGKPIIENAIDVKDHIKEIVDLDNPLKSLSTIASATTAVTQIVQMYKTVSTDVIGDLLKQKKKIKAYIKSANEVESLSDARLREIPGVELDSGNVLSKSDQEILESINVAINEDNSLKEDVDILAELNKLEENTQSNP